MFRFYRVLFALAVGASIAACGGGGGTSGSSFTGTGTTTPTGSAPTPLFASGTITGFGSIFVNGIHFQTSNAVIRKNGQVVSQSQLAVGEIARVKGSRDDNGGGSCDRVDVDDAVIGPVTAVDATASTITVLGQTIKIDSGTSFSMNIQPGDITGLAAGNFVEVSGLADSTGQVAATRIELKATAGTLQVLGKVSGLDTTGHTFKLNALLVDYSTATLDGFTGGQPHDGDAVEVRGTTFDSTAVKLTATRVEMQQTEQQQAGDDRGIEREGLITRFVSATDFDVGGKPVTTTTTTVYRNGAATDLALNVKVEVEGKANSAGVLVADRVEFHHNGGLRVRANVSAVDATAGTITVLGLQITVNANTRVEDKSSAHVEMFSLAKLNAGDTVEVRGIESPAGSGKVLAVRLERIQATTAVQLTGPFTAGTSPQFTVLGIVVDASTAQLRATNGAVLSLADFLVQAVGKTVEVSGQSNGTTLTATQVRIGRDDARDGHGDGRDDD